MITGKPFLTVEQIQKRVRELANTISADYEGRDVLAVGILKGAFMFFSDIAKLIQVPMNVDFIVASSYIKTSSTGEVVMHADVREEITGKHVIIFEDIIDTGQTLKYIRDRIMSKHPASLKICAFLDKKAHRQVDLIPDYVGFEIPDAYVVGYGLDYDNRYRNLPYIAVFKKEYA
jgi:hypoxanthine phosphoribosyltransferase